VAENDVELWVPVLAAVGASVLTGILGLGTILLQEWLRRVDALRHERRRAYSRLLAVTGVIAHTSHALHLAMEVRSGAGEGLDVALHLRKPIDPLELDARLREDVVPLYEAWSDVWTVGTQEAVTAANQAVELAGEVITRATPEGAGRTRLGARFLGEKWTREQLDAWETAINEMGKARRALASVARREAKLPVADFRLRTTPPGATVTEGGD
jgi:hypothetical protein